MEEKFGKLHQQGNEKGLALHASNPLDVAGINCKTLAVGDMAQHQTKAAAHNLGDNEAYCLRCKQIVKVVDPGIEPRRGKLILIKGTCPNCGCTINRGGRVE